MLFWLKTIFCSTQMLDVYLFLNLENTSDILKAFRKIGICENDEIQQKNQVKQEIKIVMKIYLTLIYYTI